MLSQIARFHSTLWLSNIPLYVYHIFFICLSVIGHLGCLSILAIINNTVNIFILISTFFLLCVVNVCQSAFGKNFFFFFILGYFIFLSSKFQTHVTLALVPTVVQFQVK